MVERLKVAIEKARLQREQAAAPTAPLPPRGAGAAGAAVAQGAAAPSDLWSRVARVTLQSSLLERNRIVTLDRANPVHVSFDVLRTRMLRLCRENGWSRIGVTSPTKGCGKSTIVANLLFSLARNETLRIVALDVDLRAPMLGRLLGLSAPATLPAYLRGEAAAEDCLRRPADNLVVGLSAGRETRSAELLHTPATVGALADLGARLSPDLMLFDMPPLLVGDDAMTLLPCLDAVLIVAASRQTSTAEVEECERLIAGQTPILGVLLNKQDVQPEEAYRYDYAAD